MSILVLGGLGTVGTPLVEELRLRDHHVIVADRMHHHKLDYVKCDIGHYRQLEHIFNTHPISFVYNLAAEFGRWNGEAYYESLWQTNVVGLKHRCTCNGHTVLSWYTLAVAKCTVTTPVP